MKKTVTLLLAAVAQIGFAQNIGNGVNLGKVVLQHIPEEFCYNDNNGYTAVNYLNYYDYDSDIHYIKIIDKNLNVTKEIKLVNALPIHYIGLHDNCGAHRSFSLAQTLFNDDKNYEYIQKIKKDNKITGINIVSAEDGKILQTINIDLDNQSDVEIYNIAYNYYMALTTYDCDIVLFPIGKIGNSIKSASLNNGLKAYPSVVKRNESIKISLDENASKTKIVRIYNAEGKELYKSTVPAGVMSLEVTASILSPGINIVSAECNGQKSIAKIIVE